MSSAAPVSAEPRCIQCAHFQVTWDPAAPRGCRWFGFKTPEIPSVVVQRESGRPCIAYAPKTSAKQGQ